MKEKKLKERKNYIAPLIEVTLIEMEEGFAAGSATVEPTVNPNGDVQAGWETGEDQEATPF